MVCERCNGSGEIGVRNRFTCSREVPGPVPDDARGWCALDCPDCHGDGTISADEPDDWGNQIDRHYNERRV